MKSYPYVYILMNKTTGLKYIGCKYAKNCHPDKFWETYFTSSNPVHKLIAQYGKNDFVYHILKQCTSGHEANVLEHQLLITRWKRSDYLNQHPGQFNSTSLDHSDMIAIRSKVGTVCGNISYHNKTGIHGLTKKRRLEISSNAGIIAGKINRKRGTGIFDPKVRAKQHATLRRLQISAYYDPTTRKEISSAGGKHGGFSKYYYEKNNLLESDRILEQSKRGRKGGAKNKNSNWYYDTDGYYKYTQSDAENMAFDDFIRLNPSFTPGQGPTKINSKDKIIVNNGIKSFYIPPSEFDITKHVKGRLNSLKGKIFVNDGINNYMIFSTDFDETIYKKGRLKNEN